MTAGRIHTDLALEAKEKYEEENVEIRGVVIEEDYNEEKDISITCVKIQSENGLQRAVELIGNLVLLTSGGLDNEEERRNIKQ